MLHHMFLLALQAFLNAHGKTCWANHVFTDNAHQLARVTRWAIHHGFTPPA